MPNSAILAKSIVPPKHKNVKTQKLFEILSSNLVSCFLAMLSISWDTNQDSGIIF